jgi:hypothetical protein
MPITNIKVINPNETAKTCPIGNMLIGVARSDEASVSIAVAGNDLMLSAHHLKRGRRWGEMVPVDDVSLWCLFMVRKTMEQEGRNYRALDGQPLLWCKGMRGRVMHPHSACGGS